MDVIGDEVHTVIEELEEQATILFFNYPELPDYSRAYSTRQPIYLMHRTGVPAAQLDEAASVNEH